MRAVFGKLFFIYLFCLFAAQTFAQIPPKLARYTSKDGLPHNTVLSIAKDREGFMWFGSMEGLSRYDGQDFLTYRSRSNDHSSSKNNRFDKIVEDLAGYLWLRAKDKRVYRFDKRTEQFLSVEKNMRNSDRVEYVNIIASKVSGIWLFTKKNGINYIASDRKTRPRYHNYSATSKGQTSIQSNQISFFHEDRNLKIWVGTTNGLTILNRTGKTNRPYRSRHLLANSDLRSVAEDKEYLWFGTADGTLVRYSKNSSALVKKRLSKFSINGLMVSVHGGNLFLTTSGGAILEIDREMRQVGQTSITSKPLFTIFEDKIGALWVEPEKQGIIRFQKSDRSFQIFSGTKNAAVNLSKDYYKVFQDDSGTIWACLKGGGFGYYDPRLNKIAAITNRPGEAAHQFSNIITSLLYDRQGLVWLSEESIGLHKITFQRNDFKVRKLVENSHAKYENEVKAVLQDKEGRLWLATKFRKLYCYKVDQKIKLPFVNYPLGDMGRIYDILEDSKGNLWFGTRENGLFKAEPVNGGRSSYRLVNFKHDGKDPFSISSNVIYDILEDRRGRIWVATGSGGINLISTRKSKTIFINSFRNYPKNSFSFLRNLEEDSQGNIWAGTSEGLLILNPSGDRADSYPIVSYSNKSGDSTSLSSNDIQDIYKDAKGRIWLATLGGGLNLALGRRPFDGLQFRKYTVEDGFASNFAVSILGDSTTGLWISTHNGITNFDPDLNKVRNFDEDDALNVQHFSEASSGQLKDGMIAFGSVEGLVMFKPAQIKSRPTLTKLVFTKLQINNKDASQYASQKTLEQNINYSSFIRLNHDQNIFSISFSLVDYKSERKPNYWYRLKGFDDEWKDNDNKQLVSYTNLPPGRYIFEVKARNPGLYLKTPYRSVAIEILPPFWRTWWAYLIYFCIALILAHIIRKTILTMFALRNKIIVEKRIADLRQDFFTNMSHELRTPLTLILNPLEQVLRKEPLSEQGKNFLMLARKNTERMVRFVNQFLELRKIQNNKLELKISEIELIAFVRNTCSLFTEIANEKNISINTSSNVDVLFVWLDSDKIDVVLVNLLANAIKFSPENCDLFITIEYHQGNHYFTIDVADQGKGVPESELDKIFELYYQTEAGSQNSTGTGIGLAFSKALIELHHGEAFATNNPDGGLTVTLKLLYGRSHFNSDAFASGSGAIVNRTSSFRSDYRLSDNDLPNDDHKPVVLLVEDNHDLRKFMQIQLSEHFRVLTAENGEQGFKMAIQARPDLILSDVMMPVLNGFEMLKKLKADIKTSHIPIVLLSAKQSVDSQIQGLEYGADLYISKPFNNELLLASIKGLITKRKNAFQNTLDGPKRLLPEPEELVITTQDELFLKKVVDVVSEKMTDPEFTIEYVAETIGMSRSAFFKKFKALTSLAPVEFIKEMRINRAKAYLDAGENNISSVAYAVGFNDGKYFSRCFKQLVGKTPSEYLKEKHTS